MSNRKGRDFWKKLVAEYKRSGETQESFARKRRITVWSLRRWLYKFRREQNGVAKSDGKGFRFVEVKTDAVANGRISFHLGSTVLYFDKEPDARWVAELARAYEERGSC